jgi:hypothetical protein
MTTGSIYTNNFPISTGTTGSITTSNLYAFGGMLCNVAIFGSDIQLKLVSLTESNIVLLETAGTTFTETAGSIGEAVTETATDIGNAAQETVGELVNSTSEFANSMAEPIDKIEPSTIQESELGEKYKLGGRRSKSGKKSRAKRSNKKRKTRKSSVSRRGH